MIDFTENLPPIEPGFIDNEGRATSMVTGEIFTKEYDDD
jgi:hypothetical protein